MKFLKVSAVILIVLGIIAASVHYHRESIIREFANSALREQQITATDLSIETLKPDFVELSHLVLEHDDGTRYEITGLSFPLSFPSVRAERISIEQLVITPSDTEAAPTPLADLLQTVLQMPDTVPNTEMSISSFLLPDVPPVENIVWRSMDQGQHATFNVDEIHITLNVDRVEEKNHTVKLTADVGGSLGAMSLSLDIIRTDTGFTVDGQSTVRLLPMLPMLKSWQLVPTEFVSLDAELEGPVTIALSDDATQPVSVSARLSPDGSMTMEYRSDDGSNIRVRTSSSDPIHLEFEYPSFEWTANVGQSDVLVGLDPIGELPVQISDLECRPGIHCTVHTSLNTGPFELEGVTVVNAMVSASLSITDDEITRVDILPDAVLTLTGIESQDFSVAAVDATHISGAWLIVDDDNWSSDIGHIELLLDTVMYRDSLIESLPVTLDELRVRDAGAVIDAQVQIPSETASVSWADNGMFVPGVEGTILLKDDFLTTSLVLSDGQDALSAHIDATHHLVSGKGTLSVRDATLDFDQAKLSRRFVAWPYPWDVVSGTWATNLELNLEPGHSGTDYNGTMTISANALAGNYDDTVLTGVNTKLTIALDSETGVTVAPASIAVAMLDVGVPVEQIAADFALDARGQAIQVENLSMTAFGGKLVADPFRFALAEEKNDIILRPKSIQLQFMVDLAEFKDIELGGSISGVLPMTVSETTVTITNGRLESDPPGGVIRYLPGADTEDATASDSSLGLVSRALSNFQFDSLTSDVDYTEIGDLKLQMRLTGINPDMDETQPVILNLGVENNVPQLLRSLQATRSIEEILEKRSAK